MQFILFEMMLLALFGAAVLALVFAAACKHFARRSGSARWRGLAAWADALARGLTWLLILGVLAAAIVLAATLVSPLWGT